MRSVRQQRSKMLPLTLSIGVGTGVSSLPELGDAWHNPVLDLALGRGGDQVAIKQHKWKSEILWR